MFEGFSTFFTGLSMLFKQQALRQILGRMLLLLLLLMLLLTGATLLLADYLIQLWLPQGDAWYWQLIIWFSWLLAVVLSMLTGMISFTILASAAAAPWLDMLAARTERIMGLSSEENTAPWLQQSLQAFAHSMRPLWSLLLWGMLALLLLWIPLLGGFIALTIWTYAGIRFLNFELFDTQASRMGLSFSERKQHFAESPAFWLGFGGTATLLMMLPLFNVLVIPAAVVALAKRG
ncbi:MAG: EI24 domain-containing protein [Mariprofundaceae bacterium]|nr:EI24 domain-containing protein [Mariprofundaceae bacterium]